jgi:hypothetical protein
MLGQPFFHKSWIQNLLISKQKWERISGKELAITIDFNSVHLQFSQVTSVAENYIYMLSVNSPSLLELVPTHNLIYDGNGSECASTLVFRRYYVDITFNKTSVVISWKMTI